MKKTSENTNFISISKQKHDTIGIIITDKALLNYLPRKFKLKGEMPMDLKNTDNYNFDQYNFLVAFS